MAGNKKHKKKKRPITSTFGQVFRQISRRNRFGSPPTSELASRMYDGLVAAAIAKCVDYNVVVNRSRVNRDEPFALVSGLRGICEDLIVLSYLLKFPTDRRQKLVELFVQLNLSRALEAQAAFFAANNPFQPVLKPPNLESASEETGSAEARRLLREYWERQGHSRRDGPTVRDMALNVGLQSTYEYIYFLASNFAHFNPQALLRMGWGDHAGPFYFSSRNLCGYYTAIGSFYGAVLFLGFYYAFSPTYFTVAPDRESAKLLELIQHVERWPEVVTFEEMNKPAPLFFLTHAMREVFQKEADAPYGEILKEVRGLSMLRNLETQPNGQGSSPSRHGSTAAQEST